MNELDALDRTVAIVLMAVVLWVFITEGAECEERRKCAQYTDTVDELRVCIGGDDESQ